jgi:two-component system chemotaxis sensor kinase CheA
MLPPEKIAQWQNLGEKIARELVFAEAGKDSGLLPINHLLGLIEDKIREDGTPEPLVLGARQARRWLDKIFDSSGLFSQEEIDRFGAWAGWWEEALQALAGQRTPPAPPSDRDADIAPLPAPSAPVPPLQPAAGEEPVLTLDLGKDRELLGEFVSESLEHLQNIEQGALVLEANPSDAETLHCIFRAFHTFKSSAGFLNLPAMQILAHELESLLELARQQKLAITRAAIDLILAGADTLKQFIREISAQLASRQPSGPILIPTLDLLARLRAALADPSVLQPEWVPTAGLPPSPMPPETPKGNRESAAVKVDTAKLDSLVDLVGEMIIAQSMVMQNGDLAALRNEPLNRNLARLRHISKELKHTALSLRMVPIRDTFQKMNRLVRDLAGKAGKPLHLLTQGENTELDRALVEEINDPLIHMIRNSVDHGIENAQLRQQRGKPPHGTIWLNAFHQGGSIVIEVRDDGNGLDRERILAKAVQNKIVKTGDHLQENEVFRLIMAPGFSTAEKVTDLSGRGVGLDVVQRNVEKLRGKIEIQSAAGQGSTFRIHLPLTLAIMDGLIVGAGGQRYIVPASSVCQSFSLSAGRIQTVQGRGEMIEVRGKLHPLLRLCSHFGIQPASTDPAASIAVLVASGSRSRCLVVDQLLGKQEVVIKSLGETFRGPSCVVGAAIMGDGRAALILDAHALVDLESVPLEAAA